MKRHPTTFTLSRYADGELSPHRRARVALHLARCATCSATIEQWHVAAAALRAGPIPPPSADLLERIQRRRAEGERVVLPPVAAGPPQRVRGTLLAAAATAVLLMIGSLVFFAAPDLKADASELRLLPTAPTAGALIRAEYHASSLLAGHDRLVLRARYRTDQDDNLTREGTHVVVAELARGRDGVFRASFQLPDSVVYALFVVEDPAAHVVDFNFRQGWELLVHGQDGRPLAAALEQKENDLTGRNWQEAYATARQATELYPEHARYWYHLHVLQRALLGEAGMDSVRSVHQEQLRRLHTTLAGRAEVSPEDAGSMHFYAAMLGEDTLRDHWRDRLARDHPRHPLAVQNRVVFDHGRTRWSDPPRFLAEMDRMWDEIGPRHVQQGDLGFGAARDTGDPEAIRRWAARYLHFRPRDAGWVASRLAEIPALREEGMHRLREEIRRSVAMRQEDRELFATAADQQRKNQQALRTLYGSLGKALIESGRRQAGLDTMALAVAAGWDPHLFRDMAEARLAADDTLGAVELWARVAVDPTTSPPFADSIRARMGTRFDAERWQALTAHAHETMREQVLVDATTRRVRGPVRLLDDTGAPRELGTLTSGTASVVVFWSRDCGYALDALPEIHRIAERLGARGVPMVLITGERPSTDFRAFVTAREVSIPIYHDAHREAGHAFGSAGTPEYFVLDAEGRIRFEYTTLNALERQVEALSGG